jgi:hypothetical protein
MALAAIVAAISLFRPPFLKCQAIDFYLHIPLVETWFASLIRRGGGRERRGER